MVAMALSFSLLTGTSTNDLSRVSMKVCPGGIVLTVAILSEFI